MFRKIWMSVLCLFLLDMAQGKESGEYLHRVTTDYVTPHLDWVKVPAEKKLKVLFIVPRDGAREIIELQQRMPMDYTEFITMNHVLPAQDSMHETNVTGTSVYEKKQELAEKLEKDYDVIVFGNFPLTALADEAQFRILSKVMEGTGLLLISPVKYPALPYGKIYQNPLPLPGFFQETAVKSLPDATGKLAPDQLFSSWQMGKGRVATVNYHSRSAYGLSLTPFSPYDIDWQGGYESSLMFLARCVQWAGGDDAAVFQCPELAASPTISHSGATFKLQLDGSGKVFCRIRNLENRIMSETELSGGALNIPALPGGGYYCDIRVERPGLPTACGVYRFDVASPVGKLTLTAPEVVDDRQGFTGSLSLEKASAEPLKLVLEMQDSPYARIWYRSTLDLPAGMQQLDWAIKDYYLPTPAGYLRAKLIDRQGKALAETTRLVFFPDYRLDAYVQLGWNILPASNGALYAPQLVDRFGWNIGLTHPSANGENARNNALLNQRFVPYLVRVGLDKTKDSATRQYSWFFLPGNLQAEVKKLNGDESFYRPEVQELWKAGVAHRIKNLPKYSPVIYTLGDENFFNADGGYGPSDTQYFREFLKQKYGSVDRLNAEWRANYQSFDDVPHLPQQEAKAAGNFPAWFDHRQYMEKMYADLHHFLADEIKKHDPRAKVGAEGSVPGELEQTIDKLEFWGPYSDMVEDEALRSFGGDRVRMLWWGGYLGSHGGRSGYPFPLLSDLLKGTVNGNAWYSTAVHETYSGFGVDYSPAPYLKDFLPYLDRLRWGTAQLLISRPLHDDAIRIYWSHASASARMLDERCVSPNDSIIPLIRSFYRQGLGFEYVSPRTPERLKSAKLLFLCGTSALSDAETQNILDFVRNGGTVVADLNPGILNGYLRPLDKNPLQELFGNIVFSQIAPTKLSPLKIDTMFNGVPIKFQAEKAASNGKAPIEIRKYGKGTAVLLNFSLSTAENTASDKTPFIDFVGAMLKGAGIKPDYRVADHDRFSIMRIRSGKDFDLIGALVAKEKIGSSWSVDLPGERYVYECGKGEAGRMKSLNISFAGTPFKLYTVFTAPQKAPQIKLASSSLQRGDVLKLDLKPLASDRIYLVRLFDASGQELFIRNVVFNTAKVSGELPIQLAFNDRPGDWKLELEDIATGLKSETRFTVK